MFITVYDLDDIHLTKPKYLNINKVYLMEIVPSSFEELYYLKVHLDDTTVYKSYCISKETYLNILFGVK